MDIMKKICKLGILFFLTFVMVANLCMFQNVFALDPSLNEDIVLSINPSSISVTVGQTVKVSAQISGNNSKEYNVKWMSSDGKIATIDNDGVITGISAGNTVVFAKIYDSKQGEIVAKCSVTVRQEYIDVKQVVVDRTSATVPMNTTLKLNVRIYPYNATNKSIIWASTNNAIATVDQLGTVKGIKAGSAIITATSINGCVAKCTVNVTYEPVKSITVSPTKINLVVSYTMKLAARIYPYNATNKTVVWSSSNNKIATVDKNGTVKGIKVGSAKIIARSINGLVATCEVKVVPFVAINSVKLNKTKVSLAGGTITTLTATIIPNNSTLKGVTWSSSNPAVAVVSINGVVKALQKGTAIISATAPGGKVGKCTVTVTSNAATGNLTGLITWQYNDFIGTKPDVGASVILVPVNHYPTVYDNDTFSSLKQSIGDPSVFVTTVDGAGNYYINNIPVGSYYIFVLSHNTNTYPYMHDYNCVEAKKMLTGKITPAAINSFALWLQLKSCQMGTINIVANQTVRFSHDFGNTYS